MKTNCRVIVYEDRVSLQVDDQKLSRLTEAELRDLVLQILIFCPDIRKDVEKWIAKGNLSTISEVFAEADLTLKKAIEG